MLKLYEGHERFGPIVLNRSVINANKKIREIKIAVSRQLFNFSPRPHLNPAMRDDSFVTLSSRLRQEAERENLPVHLVCIIEHRQWHPHL